MERARSRGGGGCGGGGQWRRSNKVALLFLLLSLIAVMATLKLALLLDLPSCTGTIFPSHAPVRVSHVLLPLESNEGAHVVVNKVKKREEEEVVEEEEEEEEEREEVEVEDEEEEKERESEFWRQPEGMGYRPCMEFSRNYTAETEAMTWDRSKYVVAVVTGGLNQQRNQIVDAVVIARILGAAFVMPVLDVNPIWRDESEFSDIYDWEHFKSVLADDIRVVSTLPINRLRLTPMEIGGPSRHATPDSLRTKYLKRVTERGVVLLRGFDSWLTKELPPELQRLKCKVAFHAFKFSKPILELGNRLVARMRSKGQRYLALHLRMERDVWIRTGCLPGLTEEEDGMIEEERRRHPELLTSRSKLQYHERKLAGLCPLTVVEVTRLLKALGCPKDAAIYWAGGEPFGGPSSLSPLLQEFPFLYNKDDIALPGELEPYRNKSSILAAIDYVVVENSDVFMPSHGGNMGRAIRGLRAYQGHRKCITPNKRRMMPHFLNDSLEESMFNKIVRDLHADSTGKPRSRPQGWDVTLRPVPLCMCRSGERSPRGNGNQQVVDLRQPFPTVEENGRRRRDHEGGGIARAN